MTYRIWIDQDSVLYDLHGPWLAAHNTEYPNHILTIDQHKGWDATAACKEAGCPANVYTYFTLPSLWTDGDPLPDSQRVTKLWTDLKKVELGIISTAANAMSMPYKIEWLQKYFPYIKDVLISHKAHVKHELRGDILIDDGLHNLEHWQGVGICFTQPWNKDARIVRANDWNGVDRLVRRTLQLLDEGCSHELIQYLLYQEM